MTTSRKAAGGTATEESTMDSEALDALADERLQWQAKGFPFDGRFATVRSLRAAKPSLFTDGFATPLATLRADALEHNLNQMSAFCRDHKVSLAPHGKTTMAPQLWSQQLAHGAWGITVATPWQARVGRVFGVPRLLLANELTDPAGIAWLSAELDADPDLAVLSYVDDPAVVRTAEAILADRGAVRPLDVLVEVGFAGGRTGCRDDAAVDEVVDAVRRSAHHRLVGVGGYEGTLGHDITPTVVEPVLALLCRIRSTAERLVDAGAFDGTDPVVLSAGGSAYFDFVTEELAGDFRDGRAAHVVLRSGGYVSHDNGLYGEVSPFHRRPELGGDLDAAIEVWTRVLSRPEPGLVLLDAGRRDLPFDVGLPVPRRLRRDGHLGGNGHDGLDGVNGMVADAPAEWQLADLNDQHAYLVLPSDAELAAGDRVSLGISHPCTLFDKWTWLPVVEADGTVIDAIRTFF